MHSLSGGCLFICPTYRTVPDSRSQESDEHRQQQREAEEMLRQTEEDTDQEILQLKNKYEWQLRKRQEECTKLKGELGLQTKKVHVHLGIHTCTCTCASSHKV